MRTPIADPDLEIPEIDVSTVVWLPNPFARQPGEMTEIRIDGAVGYALRLIPSNKLLARFDSTLEAWPVILAAIEGGRSPRTLAFDAILANGSAVLVSAGPRLEMWARYNHGEPNPYGDAKAARPRRVAETG